MKCDTFVKMIDDYARLLLTDGKIIIEEKHGGDWKEVFKVSEVLCEPDSVEDYYMNRKFKSLYGH